MSKYKTTLIFLVVFYCELFLLPSSEAAYLDDGRPISSILNELFDSVDVEKNHQSRRQLDFGDEPTVPESWTGRWFPEKETPSPRPPPLLQDIPPQSDRYPNSWLPPIEPIQNSPPHRTNMGSEQQNSMWKMINSTCDDGKTNLTVDWSGSPFNYTCTHQYFLPNYDLPNIILKSLVPKAYRARHECMNKEIHYNTDLPTFGTHRPAWPRYGEYKFVPKQRWLHSLEHGGIVMLYHPCAHPQLVKELKEMVTGCLYRHITTPYTLLSPDRPLALVSWGWAMMMSAPDEANVHSFIKTHAKNGPETTPADGQFSEGLVSPAQLVSDINDSVLCPPSRNTLMF